MSTYNDIRYLKGSRSWWTHVDNASEASHFIHNLFVSGDYVGGSVQAANRKSLLENTELCERLGIEELNEAYSTDSILFPIECIKDAEIIELFDALENYPLIDDEMHSQVERELETECFESFGRREFKELLRVNELLTDEKLDSITDEQLDAIYFEAACHTNYNIFTVESGTSGYFDFDSFGGLYNKKIEVIKQAIKEVR